MKLLSSATTRITLLLLTFFSSFVAFAQEGGADVNVDINKNSGGGGWYTNPIVWIIGAAVFILLLVALLRGNSSRD